MDTEVLFKILVIFSSLQSIISQESCRSVDPSNNYVIYQGRCTPLAACTYLPTTKTAQSWLERCVRKGVAVPGWICCPNEIVEEGKYLDPSTINSIRGLNEETFFQSSQVTFTPEEINDAFARAQQKQLEIDQQFQNGFDPSDTSEPEFLHEFLQFSMPESQFDARQSFLNVETASQLASKFQSGKNVTGLLQSININGTNVVQNCPTIPKCTAQKYRTINGSCNNLKNGDWGRSLRGFGRMMLPDYADGISKPRVAFDGSPLASTRLISTTVLLNTNSEADFITLLHMSFGQFLDHDLTQTPITRGANGSAITCCSRQNLLNTSSRHPECFPIDIPNNDPFYSRLQTPQTCMEFVRTSDSAMKRCQLSHREQQNQLTSFIDASQVYGSEDRLAARLRSFVDGKLRVASRNGRDFPPHNNSAGCRGDENAGQFCFVAGDTRPNEQPQLASLQIIFLREHNRIATELKRLNPGPTWNDETLYQETRRIIGAMMQQMVVGEYLPILLGRQVMSQFFLLPTERGGYQRGYGDKLDSTIWNEFATAAFRFGHSTVQGTIQLGTGTSTTTQQLRNLFLRPFETGLVDSYLTGCTFQKMQNVENFITDDLTTMLFRSVNASFGLDLPAINMQRGRDHGIPSYLNYRKLCKLWIPRNWNELNQILAAGVVASMQKVYKNIEDIDLWLGLVSETPYPGAIVGETLVCLLGAQFYKLKWGDRYWFEWQQGTNMFHFSQAQLAEIRKASLARVICDNSGVSRIQALPFYTTSTWNPIVPCSDITGIPKMSLNPWKISIIQSG